MVRYSEVNNEWCSNGIMLLLFNPVNNSIPMTIINVHTGTPLMNIAYQGQLKDIEFVEQFNENILIKQKDKPLKIHDILTNQSKIINNFENPDAFIFVYEKELFISLQSGRISMWSTDGNMVTKYLKYAQFDSIYSFDKELLYSQQSADKKAAGGSDSERNYVISLSQSRKFLLTLIKENQLEHTHNSNGMNNHGVGSGCENPEMINGNNGGMIG